MTRTNSSIHNLSIPAPTWLQHPGPDQDGVLSSRCRIARNLSGFPFPWRATELQCKTAAESLLDAAQRGGGPLSEAKRVRAEDLTEEALEKLIEYRYASPLWASSRSPLASDQLSAISNQSNSQSQHPTPITQHRLLLISPSGDLSMMIHEEDHIRLQAVLPGLQLDEAERAASDAAGRLEESVQFAKNDRIGYLTASPANAGAGMRVSAMIHLIGLARAGQLRETLQAADELGAAVRGTFGEGSRGVGAFFQVSNRRSTGPDTRLIVQRVRATADYLIERERAARDEVWGSPAGRQRLEEEAVRTLRTVFESELSPDILLANVSLLRLAVALGMIRGDLQGASEWVYLAGSCADLPDDSAEVRFQAIRRSAAVRQRLRDLLGASGTF